jgi:tetratricopeptide (TPR) repeat protein
MKTEKLILKYINNTLSKEDKLVFDKLMETDKPFREEVTFHSNLKKVTEKKDDDDFKELISNIESKFYTPKKNYKKWYIAAAIIALIGISYFFSTTFNSNEKLFTANFKPYRNIMQPVVRGDENDELKSQAFNAYENKNFEKAINLFDKILVNNGNSSIQFYKANALLALDKVDEAIVLLKNDISIQDSFHEKRYWFLALAYLKKSDIKNSRKNLTLLLEVPKSTYKKKEAKQLIKKFD